MAAATTNMLPMNNFTMSSHLQGSNTTAALAACHESSLHYDSFHVPSSYGSQSGYVTAAPPGGGAIIAPTGSPVRQLKRLHPGATNTATELLRCKRRIDFVGGGPYGYSLPVRQVSSVARRNERERNRVRLVNHGFALLRQHVPSTAGRSKKMSKVDTLKAAVEYIQQLRDVLEQADDAMHSSTQEGGPTTCRLPTASSSSTLSAADAAAAAATTDAGSLPTLSPASSVSSREEGAHSPGGMSSSSSDDASSSTSRDLLHQRRYTGGSSAKENAFGLEDDVDDFTDFASWFC